MQWNFAASRDQNHHWSWLCCDTFLPILLAFFLTSLQNNLQNWPVSEHTLELKWPMLNRWFHSSRVKFPLVTVCKFVLGVNFFDLNLGIKINSIEQPIKNNSVGPGNMSHCGTPSFDIQLDHCFVVLKQIQQRFLMRRLDVWGNQINTIQNIEHSSRSLVWPVTFNTVHNGSLRSIVGLNFVSKDKNNQIPKIESGNPVQSQSNGQRNDFGFCPLCEPEFCFLHIKLLGTNVWLSKTHNVPPEVDVEPPRSPAKSESWNSPNLHCLAVLPTWQYCLYSLVWWIYEINRFKRLPHALVHSLIDRASLFTENRISGRPIRAKYQYFKTIWEHTCDNPPTNFISSSLKWWTSMHGVDTL